MIEAEGRYVLPRHWFWEVGRGDNDISLFGDVREKKDILYHNVTIPIRIQICPCLLSLLFCLKGLDATTGDDNEPWLSLMDTLTLLMLLLLLLSLLSLSLLLKFEFELKKKHFFSKSYFWDVLCVLSRSFLVHEPVVHPTLIAVE